MRRIAYGRAPFRLGIHTWGTGFFVAIRLFGRWRTFVHGEQWS